MVKVVLQCDVLTKDNSPEISKEKQEYIKKYLESILQNVSNDLTDEINRLLKTIPSLKIYCNPEKQVV